LRSQEADDFIESKTGAVPAKGLKLT